MCKTLCIVLIFINLWSIYWNAFLNITVFDKANQPLSEFPVRNQYLKYISNEHSKYF